jgi:hypothetical protein
MNTQKEVHVSDKFQTGYVYTLSEQAGKNFDADFTPHITPQKMLALGVFDGVYFWDLPDELPQAWYEGAKISPNGKRDKSLNYFDVSASKPLKYWQKKGWIHPDDPRGWFQWYARYYLGRRHQDDVRQIKRWKAFRRHWVPVEKNCQKGDFFCRTRQRQALLHWAYDSTKI